MKKGQAVRESRASENFRKGYALAQSHPLIAPLIARANVIRRADTPCPSGVWADGWARVTPQGDIFVHPEKLAEPEEWLYVLAHCVLHLGFGHFKQHLQQREWDLACECAVWQFLATLKLGKAPESLRGLPAPGDPQLPARNEEDLFRFFCESGISPNLPPYSVTGSHFTDMAVLSAESAQSRYWARVKQPWPELFGQGLVQAVSQAVNVAGGIETGAGGHKRGSTAPQRAREWFISSFPLLGSLAAVFDLIEDAALCGRMQISVAAVSDYQKEIYVNPGAGLSELECRFVIAHELLHVSLRHSARCRGRDPYFWNIACDYVINEWLTEMRVGSVPLIGLLLDPDLKGLSAEAIYDRIVTDLRRFRRLGTFRGVGLGDILDGPPRGWWLSQEGTDLDAFYRSCLAQGLLYHQDQGRGFLPAGLVEEIKALNQPAIPWDVELAFWLDHYFPPVEQIRTYGRPSRRQSSTPDIARPRYVRLLQPGQSRTFGVVLDTSGSMSRTLLAESLGAIASYCESREVPLARVVFCDAAAYDAGYMRPDEIAARVKVLGRGGTVLQPGIDLLENADNFPQNGPILIITDGACDHFRTRREHAILLPEGRSLPFSPRGKVFRMSR